MLNLLSAVVPEGIQTIDINNRPFVMPGEKVLLPLGRDKVDRSIYELRDWEGNYLADTGEVPEGSLFLPEGGGDVFLSAIESREIPGILKRRAFPVSDQANHGELFLIYSATARIVKYDTTGTKLWERKIQPTPEIEAVTRDYFKRYKLISGTGSSLPSVFDIDFDGRRFFVVTNEAEIRAYPF